MNRRKPSGAAVLRADKTERIVRGVLEELADRGWDRLTMDGVARRAKVGKPALYRRWGSKDEMILDCVVRSGATEALPGDTGSVEADLLAYAREAVDALRDPLVGPVIAAVLVAAADRPGIAQSMDERFRAPRRAAARAALDRAVARGEIPPDVDFELATDLLAGPLYMYALGVPGAIPADYPDRLVAGVLAGLGFGRAFPRR